MDGDAADAIAIPDAKSGDADTASQRVTDSNPNGNTIGNADAAVRNPNSDTERHSDTYSDTERHSDTYSDAITDANADPVMRVQRETAWYSRIMHLPGTDVYR